MGVPSGLHVLVLRVPLLSCKVLLLLALSFDFLAVLPSSTGPKDGLQGGCPKVTAGFPTRA